MSGSRCDDVDVSLSVSYNTVETEGDQIITALFNEYQSKASSRHNTVFKLQVMTRVIQLMGPLSSWVSRQANNNPYLYDTNYEFMLDTLKFINTGKRQYSNMLTWYDLLNEYPSRQPGVTIDRWNSLIKNVTQDINFDYMSKWINQPNGFDDIMMTAMIMFGESKTPRNRNRPDLIQ